METSKKTLARDPNYFFMLRLPLFQNWSKNETLLLVKKVWFATYIFFVLIIPLFRTWLIIDEE